MKFTIGMRFVDTNVLLYALNSDESAKYERARHVLAARDLAFSVQVLQEFYVQATRIGRSTRIGHHRALTLIRDYTRFPVQPMTVQLLTAALATKERYQISYWDAAIVEAARTLGCTEVLTEDLNHGQDFGGVCVVNPFRDA